MTWTCPDGHTSSTSDYCDQCGAVIDGSAAAPPAPSASAPPAPAGTSLDLDPPSAPAPARDCPNCGNTNDPHALFCEDCGYDFTTGQLPTQTVFTPPTTAPVAAQQAPGPVDWVVEVWVDPDWYAAQTDPEDPCPTPSLPTVVKLPSSGGIIGRSRHGQPPPLIDLSIDSAVSRRHAQLTLRSDRWQLEDLGSTNGTFLGSIGADLPTDRITTRVELTDDARVFLGAFTKLVLRRATDDERGA
jgi:hypothetical protein